MLKIYKISNLAFILVIFIFLLLSFRYVFAQTLQQALSKRFVLVVNSIIPDSPAEKSGIAVGDIIYSLNDRLFYDQEMTSLAEEFVSYVKSLPQGSHNLVVLRRGERVYIKLKLPSLSTSPRLGIIIEVLENNSQIYFEKAIDAVNRATTRDDLKKAANLFEKAKVLSPIWLDVYYNLGLIYEKLDYYDKAIENFTEYVLLKKSPDVENINMIIERNKRKYEALKNAKSKMVNGNWILIKKIPQSELGYLFYPKFKIDKSGQIWNINPLSKLDLTSIDDRADRKTVKKNISEFPWFPVKFDGRFFEIRVFSVWPFRNRYYSPFYQIFKGEIDLNSPFPIIIIREFSKRRFFEEYYNSIDEGLHKASQNFKEIQLDIEEFKYEYHYRLE